MRANETKPSSRRRTDCRAGARLPVLLLSTLLVTCRAPGPPSELSPAGDASCIPVAAVPGPEDLVLDGDRLLVSSHDRRRGGGADGAVYALTLPSPGVAARAERLTLAGRDACSFRPHGLSRVDRLIAPGSKPVPLLYIVNHHRAEDATPAANCLAAASEVAFYRRPFTSVEVFVVERHRLRFVQRFAEPRVLTHGNDLVALANGDVYVTSPPHGALALWLERDGPNSNSKIVQIRCRSEELICHGTFSVIFEHGRFLNGIAHRPGLLGKFGKLYVTATFEGRLYEVDLDAVRDRQGLLEGRPLGKELPGLDNLTWADPTASVLLAAGSANLRRLAQHAISPWAASPSILWRLEIGPQGEIDAMSFDPGGLVSGASVVVELEGASGLVVGQAFGAAVYYCSAPPGGFWSAG